MPTSGKIPNYDITTPPTAGSVVTLAEARDHLRVDFTDDDALIQLYIDVAEELIQSFTNQLLKTQVQQGNFSHVMYSQFEELPFITFKRFPVTSIDTVEIHDGTTFNTLTVTTDYLVEQREKQFLRVLFKEIDAFSSENTAYPIRITATCGYPDSTVPDKLKQAIKMLTAKFYDNRGDCSDDTSSRTGSSPLLPKDLKLVLGPCRIREVYG